MKYAFLFLILFLGFSSCEKTESTIPISKNNNTNNNNNQDECLLSHLQKSWTRRNGDTTWLYGGDGLREADFNITDWSLKACRLRFGLGREFFKALIEPEYYALKDRPDFYNPTDKCIYTVFGDEVKVYPYKLMREHEVINEVIDGRPVMIAYCILADLGAVYTREYCGEVLTFALSGYTYSDPDVWDGTDAFVFWDRETESLWWPLEDQAVSGEMLGESLRKYGGTWKEATMKEVNKQYPNALVLESGQSMEPPQDWPKMENPCR